MKSTGIIGKFDNLGRTVIPIELRRKLGAEFEIYMDGDKVVLEKVSEECALCGATENLTEFNEKSICADCIAKIKAVD